jgi:hypothetical protein
LIHPYASTLRNIVNKYARDQKYSCNFDMLMNTIKN